MNCPVCNVTIWPNTIASHFEQELRVLSKPPPERWRFKTNHSEKGESSRAKKTVHQLLMETAKQALDGARRRRFRHEHPVPAADGPGPSRVSPGPSRVSSSASGRTCPVCDVVLASDEREALEHVSGCLNAEESGDGFEVYTWGVETRVRTTSLLSAQARASESIISPHFQIKWFIKSLLFLQIYLMVQ